MDLSIIIVNYNTKKLTIEAIQSIYSSQTKYTFEIILVDNASSDGTIEAVQERFPQVRCIQNKENEGFSKANNIGLKVAKGRYLLLLNSDTVVQEDTFDVMLEFMDNHPSVGASGCKVVLPDGSLDKACRRGFPTPAASFYYFTRLAKLFPNSSRFNQYHMGHLDENDDYPVDCLVGAFMLVRREIINDVGLLDEEYFMYGEDIDWCYRIKEAGWDNYYYPKTSIIHYKGASSRRKPRKIVYEFHRAMYLFHRKHFHKKYNLLVNATVYAGIAAKGALALAMNRLRKQR
ncbi:dTDP-Rha:A-D-GlcNAc-diphosphoryl polyprenol, A-3-L-rhamnosyl transferase WbbL [Halalkalibacter wakoensis JCM 9140]|uniref:dTDP-Rha:A-D-GlcNAc-diphosphoryl polyprenol, A-3-L-rhamnosyl transferase WbbL n=1 Tax=Halalkalibacter wakoensis JCM 9140 TaxID=1236970 RepID=W4Q4I1_9BACI|nr:glycosyltransferase family 2 protein [Halalkalibacter wakoensis]GAE26274.1 dTDP-Rha:A-D-GlcNAc-diphosphoryl polyprenol, A-3-L-rhamnosyl transferase WbbL [Halalkalibacter wakoensis JCM 9140]